MKRKEMGMIKRVLSVAVIVSVVLYGCAMLRGPAQNTDRARSSYQAEVLDMTPPAYAGERSADRPRPAFRSALPNGLPEKRVAPRPQPATPSGTRRAQEADFGSTTHTLTDSLHRLLDKVKKQEVEIVELKDTVANLEEELARKKQTVKDLTEKLQKSTVRVQKLDTALGKWKQDVLGFRDEMRQAEQAEMQALTEVIMLLRGLKRPQKTEGQEEKK